MSMVRAFLAIGCVETLCQLEFVLKAQGIYRVVLDQELQVSNRLQLLDLEDRSV